MNESIFAPAPLVGFAARWLTFAGVLLALGCVVFRIAVVGRAALARDHALRLGRHAAACGAIGALAVAIGALARLYFQTAEMRFPDDPWLPIAAKLVGQTSWGWLWLAQMGLALIVAIVLRRAARERGSAALWRAAALLAVGLTVTPSLTSHAMSGHVVSHFITLPADMLHLLGAGTWLGTLAVMIVAVWGGRAASDATDRIDASRGAGASDRTPVVGALLVHFSPLALLGAAAVVASGIVSSYAHLGGVGNLVRTTYGRLLLLKVVVVLSVVAFGWRNWKRMTPRLKELGDRAMLRSAAGEVVLAMLVLAVTAALVITPPPTGHP